jgi:hypothetical protein
MAFRRKKYNEATHSDKNKSIYFESFNLRERRAIMKQDLRFF